MADAKEAEEAADRIMAEEQEEAKNSQEESTNPEPDGNQGKDPTPAEPPATGFNYAVGRLIRLVKPSSSLGKVDQVVFEFTKGRFVTWNFTVKSSSVYVMGFNMANANLGLFLDYGEKCIVKYKHK